MQTARSSPSAVLCSVLPGRYSCFVPSSPALASFPTVVLQSSGKIVPATKSLVGSYCARISAPAPFLPVEASANALYRCFLCTTIACIGAGLPWCPSASSASVSCHVATGPGFLQLPEEFRQFIRYGSILFSLFLSSISLYHMNQYLRFRVSVLLLLFYLRYGRLPCPLLPLLRPCSDECVFLIPFGCSCGCGCKIQNKMRLFLLANASTASLTSSILLALSSNFWPIGRSSAV